MAKLADALDLGSSAARHAGSSPVTRTKWVYSLMVEPAVYTVKTGELRYRFDSYCAHLDKKEVDLVYFFFFLLYNDYEYENS